MSHPQLRTTVAIGDGLDRDGVVRSLEADGGVRAGGIVGVRPDALPTLEALRDDAVVIACAGESDDVLEFIRGAVAQRASRPVVVLYAGHPNGFTRKAFAAGVDDLVVAEPDDEAVGPRIAFALEKALARRDHSTMPSPRADEELAEVLCVMGPKGGAGKTTVTANLAVALARAGKRVVAVDLDLQFGDLGLTLGLAPERTIFDLATAGGGLDAEKLDAYLVPAEAGVRVLMAPIRPDQADAVSVELVRSVVAVLRTMADVVLLDTLPGFTAHVIAAVDAATQVCMVGTLDAPSLKNTRLAMHALELMGVEPGRVTLVLNRADVKDGLTPADAATVLGRVPDVVIPVERAIAVALNQGRSASLGRSSEAGRAFAALTAVYAPEDGAGRRRRPVLRRRVAARSAATPAAVVAPAPVMPPAPVAVAASWVPMTAAAPSPGGVPAWLGEPSAEIVATAAPRRRFGRRAPGARAVV